MPPGGDADETDSFYANLIRVVFEDTEGTLVGTGEERDGGWPRIPGFEIEGVLGIGGMGIVYKARQIRLERFVALKVIRAGAGARPRDLARFEAEARAVAAIDHPNIIKIHEIGEYGGLPYFSLEYLEGGSLSRLIGGQPQPVDECARIVEVLARAMEVAHRRKIIHRDLKPANILIAADGTLKIADFGLAKRLEGDPGDTGAGSILGSPSYMAPEQAEGSVEIGPAADQYALGATLYELLTGRPPFRGLSALDTLWLVRTQPPVPPSQLLPRLPRDMETICLKCLEKEPGRRYPDVAALAEDLRRFQAREPIVARPISAAKKSWMWCRRNPKLAGLVALAAFLLLIVAAVSTSAAVMISGRNRALGQALVRLREAKDEVEEKQRRAVAAGRAAIAQNESVVETQRKILELTESKLRYEPALQDFRRQTLDLVTGSLESSLAMMITLRAEIGWPAENEERNWRTVARARQRLGELSLSRGQYAEAMRQIEQVDEIVARLAAAAPGDVPLQLYAARIRRQLGTLARDKIGDVEAALRLLRRAAEIDRAVLAKDPRNDVYKNELANTTGQLALSELRLGHLPEARALFEQELAIRDSFGPEWANRQEIRREISGLHEQLIGLYSDLGMRAEAERSCARCTELREQVVAGRPDWWPAVNDLARSYDNAGFLRFPEGGDPAGARRFHRKSIELIARRVEADPANLETQGRLAESLYYEATSALHSGDADGARAGYRRCLVIRRRLASEPGAKIPQADLMVAMARCGEHAQAATIARSLVIVPPKDEQIYFQAACGYALAAGAARDEGRDSLAVAGSLRSLITAGLDAILIRAYTAAALDCLRRAKKLGWVNVARLESDPDLAPVRDTPAFRALLAGFPRPASSRP